MHIKHPFENTEWEHATGRAIHEWENCKIGLQEISSEAETWTELTQGSAQPQTSVNNVINTQVAQKCEMI